LEGLELAHASHVHCAALFWCFPRWYASNIGSPLMSLCRDSILKSSAQGHDDRYRLAITKGSFHEF
jgi:hypothetical protein